MDYKGRCAASELWGSSRTGSHAMCPGIREWKGVGRRRGPGTLVGGLQLGGTRGAPQGHRHSEVFSTGACLTR